MAGVECCMENPSDGVKIVHPVAYESFPRTHIGVVLAVITLSAQQRPYTFSIPFNSTDSEWEADETFGSRNEIV